MRVTGVCTAEKFSLSAYAEGLAQEPRRRYEGNLLLICCFCFLAAPGNLPLVESRDIVAQASAAQQHTLGNIVAGNNVA